MKMHQSHQENTNNKEQETHIEDLPSQILLIIFAKFSNNAQALCRLYLVSKYFSSVVVQLTSLNITLSTRNSYLLDHLSSQNRVFNFLIRKFISPSLKRALNPLAAMRFIAKFKGLRRLHLRMPALERPIDDYHNPPILKWDALFGDCINFCAIFMAKSIVGPHANPLGESELQALTLTDEVLKSRLRLARVCFRDALWRHHMFHHIIRHQSNDSLEFIMCPDTKKEGNLFIMKDGISCLKRRTEEKTFDMREGSTSEDTGFVRLWHENVLHLPESNRVVYGATLVMIRFFDGASLVHAQDMSFLEDEITREAMLELCKLNDRHVSMMNIRL